MLYRVLQFNPKPDRPARVLATDLDGTFIPLPDNTDNRDALSTFHQARAQRQMDLVYATGRHLESTLAAMKEHHLPEPDWIVCDVGTSIHHRQNGAYLPFPPYEIFLTERTYGIDRAAVESVLHPEIQKARAEKHRIRLFDHRILLFFYSGLYINIRMRC